MRKTKETLKQSSHEKSKREENNNRILEYVVVDISCSDLDSEVKRTFMEVLSRVL